MPMGEGQLFKLGGRSLERLENASTKRQLATRGLADTTGQEASRVTEQARYRDSQIATGLKAWGDANDAADEKKRKEEMHRLDTQIKTTALNQSTEQHSRNIKAKDLEIAGLEADQAKRIADQNRTDALNAGTEDSLITGFVGSKDFKSKKPPDWDKMSRPQQAAFVDRMRKTEKEELDKRLAKSADYRASVATELAQSEGELRLVSGLADVAAKGALTAQQVKDMTANPGLASIPDEKTNPKAYAAYKNQEKSFEKIKAKTDSMMRTQRTVKNIGKLGGVAVNPDGTVSPEQMEKWSQGGFEGWFKEKLGDPNARQIRAEMVNFTLEFAQTGAVGAVNQPGERLMALRASGLSEDGANAALLEEIGQDSIKTLFATQAKKKADLIQDAAKDFQEQNGYNYIPKQQVMGMLYSLAPGDINQDDTDKKAMTLEDFSALGSEGTVPGQAQLNLVFGTSSGKNNVNAPEAFSQAFALERKAAAGELYATQPAEFNFKSNMLSNAQDVVNQRNTAVASMNSPDAQGGIDRGRPLATGPVGPVLNPQTANPSTPTMFDSFNKSWQAVSGSSLNPAAGATPQGGQPAFVDQYVKKTKPKPTWQDDAKSAFSGYSPGGNSGTATASP